MSELFRSFKEAQHRQSKMHKRPHRSATISPMRSRGRPKLEEALVVERGCAGRRTCMGRCRRRWRARPRSEPRRRPSSGNWTLQSRRAGRWRSSTNTPLRASARASVRPRSAVESSEALRESQAVARGASDARARAETRLTNLNRRTPTSRGSWMMQRLKQRPSARSSRRAWSLKRPRWPRLIDCAPRLSGAYLTCRGGREAG